MGALPHGRASQRREEEREGRDGTIQRVFDGRFRHGVERVTGPVGRRLVAVGVTADVLTGSGLLFSVATAVVVATGHLLIAIPLLTLTGFHDLLDGPVAKASGTASVRGAFFDSVSDRVADAVLMIGVAWYLVSVHEGDLVLLPLAVLGASSLVSYVRAKADLLGLGATNRGILGGLMERAERMILLGAGFLEPWLLVPVLWVLLGLTLLTAGARFVTAWRAAGTPDRPDRRDHAETQERQGVVTPTAWGATPSAARRRALGDARRAKRRGTHSAEERAARRRLRREQASAERAARARARRERALQGRGRQRARAGGQPEHPGG